MDKKTLINIIWIAFLSLLIVCLFGISILAWTPSIIVWIIAPLIFLNKKQEKLYYLLLIIGIIYFNQTIIYFILSSFTNSTQIVAEELPLIGIIFIIHIIHFYKYIPRKYIIPTIILTGIGLIKLKYLFLATPFLLIGLIKKEQLTGICIAEKRIPLLFIILILGVGWVITAINLYPTDSNIQEIQEVIRLSNDNNIVLYNDFGSGWLITYLGKEVEYKASYPNPDYNNLKKPYYAYTNKKLDCTKINNKTYFCESLMS